MSNTITPNAPKVFRISDLVGSSSSAPKERRGRNKRCKAGPIVETSAFKLSNRLAVQGNKAKRNKPCTSNVDLLWLHDEKLKHFKNLKEVVLPQKLEMLKHLPPPDKEDIACARKRKKLEAEIEDIRSGKEERIYFDQTNDIVREYRIMLTQNDESNMTQDMSGGITQFITKYDNLNKQRLTEQYCRIINNGLLVNVNRLKFDNTICEECGAETMYNEGFLSCTECGLASDKSIHEFRLSYHDYREIMVKSPFSYKRISRFQDILSTLQAKDNSDIPDYVMEAVQKEMNKEKNLEPDQVDRKRVRQFLKRLSLNSFYDHASHILNRLNNIPPINIPPEVEEQLKDMFRQIQDPFEIVKNEVCPSRSSFLSYNFVLYKFCELLDLEEYKRCFTLLTSEERLRVQDKIWKGICKILSWEYIPSS